MANFTRSKIGISLLTTLCAALHQVPDCERVTCGRKSSGVVEDAPGLDTIRCFGHELLGNAGEQLRAILGIVDPWRPMQAVVGQAAPATRLTDLRNGCRIRRYPCNPEFNQERLHLGREPRPVSRLTDNAALNPFSDLA